MFAILKLRNYFRIHFHWQIGDLESGQQFKDFGDLLFMYEHQAEITVRMHKW